jgi:uncharacterized repeat protein (TIGR01451 family)
MGVDKVMHINPDWTTPLNVTIEAVTIRYGTNVQPYADYDSFGGGIDWESSGTGRLTIYNSVIADNYTTDGDGGGIVASNGRGDSGSPFLIKDSQIINNQAGLDDPQPEVRVAQGAGIYVFNEDSTAPASLYNGQYEITGTTISGNRSWGDTAPDGAGIYTDQKLTITNSTISGNIAKGMGGGMVSALESGDTLTLVNVTISDNSAHSHGGGLMQIHPSIGSATTLLNHVTIAGNTADADGNTIGEGGGFIKTSGNGTVTFRNTLVADNTDTTWNNGNTSTNYDNLKATLDPASHNNLLGTGHAGGLVNGTNGNLVNVANAGLLTLANNGGTTQTRGLRPGSPALDAGATYSGQPTTDQRGLPRKNDAADADITDEHDIGAFEAHPMVEDIADKTTWEDTPISFTFDVGDADHGIDSIVSTSSNQTIVPNANVAIAAGPTASQRTLTITPAPDQYGTVTISVTATDANGGANVSVTDTFTLLVKPRPNLTVTKTGGPFRQGQTNATYTLNVSNVGPGATDTTEGGAVTLDMTLPAGLTLASAPTGTGWTCTTAPLRCTTTTNINPAASAQPITLKVNVDDYAAPTVTTTATVSGAMDNTPVNNTDATPTQVVQVADLLVAKSHVGDFREGQQGATYTLVVRNEGPGPTDAPVTVTETVPAGLTLVSMSGTGWTCVPGGNTCTRSDVLPARANAGDPWPTYPAITVTVNLANDTDPAVTNQAAVAGGGEHAQRQANNSASDPTTIVQVADMKVSKAANGAFRQGDAVSYTLTVTNDGDGVSDAPIVVTDTLPAKVTATGFASQSGLWTCTLGATVSCTRTEVMAVGATDTITIDVTLAQDVALSVTNNAAVSGGGEAETSNNTTSLVTAVQDVNFAPVVTAVADQTADENQAISLQVTATDIDGDTITYSATGLPAGLAINSSTGLISGTITYDAAAGSPYSVTVTAIDSGAGNLTGTASFTWTVNNVNRAPAFTGAATNQSQTINEGEGLTAMAAADPDGQTLTFTLAGGELPPGITLGADGTYAGTATNRAAGAYTPQIQVSDGELTATVTLAITVNDVNTPPTLDPIAGQTSAENQVVSLQVTAADADDDPLTYSATGLPAGLAINSATGAISGTVSFDAAAGSPYSVTVTVTDLSLAVASQSFTWTVTNTNRAPAFGAEPTNTAQTIGENQGLAALTAADPDGQALTFTLDNGALPPGITLNADGTFSGVATYQAAGSYTATVKATDPEAASASTTLAITVTNVDTTPTLEAVPNQTNQETDTVSLQLVGADADGDPLEYVAWGLPDGLTLDWRTGLISGTLSYTSAGTHTVQVSVVDPMVNGVLHEFTWTVTNTNRAPAFTAAPANTAQTVSEGEGLAALAATDPDGDDTLTFALNSGALPLGITLNADGTFTGTISYQADRNYTAVIRVSDGTGTADTTLAVTTVQVNLPPTVDPIADQTSAEADTISWQVGATDPDGEGIAFAATGLPPGLSISEFNGMITGTLSYEAAAASPYSVTVRVTDPGDLFTERTFTWTVTNTNRAPAFTGAAANTAQSIDEAEGLTALAATDADGDTVTYTLAGGALPPGISLNSNGSFTGTATYQSAGTHTATIAAADGDLSTTTTLVVTVANVDLTPTLAAVPDQTSQENDTVSLQLAGADLDGDTLTYSAAGLPDGLAVNSATGEISGTIEYFTEGAHSVTVTVADPAGHTATRTFTWTVNDRNRAPFFTGAATNTAQSINETQGLAALEADDLDHQALTYSLAGGVLPPGITLNADGSFAGTATHEAAGDYTATIAVTDGIDTASIILTITVGDVNRAPAFTGAATNTAQSVNEGEGLTALAATDPDGDNLLTFTLKSGALPPGITLNADGSFTGTVSYLASSSYTAVVSVSDGTAAADTTLAVTVGNVNLPPTVTAIANQTSAETDTVSLQVEAAEPDSQDMTYTATGLPEGLTINGTTGLISGTLTYEASAGSPYSVTVRAADPDGLYAERTFTWTVTNTNRAPAFSGAAANTAQTVAEGEGLTALAATDPDGESLTFAVVSGNLPEGVSLNADGTFSGAVSYQAAGSYTAQVRVTDGDLSDTTTLAITVSNTDTLPTLAAVADQSNREYDTVSLLLSGSDVDGDALTYSVTGLPDGLAVNSSTGAIVGTIDYFTEGDYSVTVTVSDPAGHSASRTFTWTVTDRNRGPAFTGAATNTAQAIAEAEGLVAMAAMDDDAQPLTFTVTGGSLPPGITLNSDGTFAGTASHEAAPSGGTGSYSATIRVSDGLDHADTTLAVTVTNVNRAPVLPALNDRVSGEGQAISYSVAAADADGDPLTYTVTGLPTGLSYDSATGLITGTPPYESADVYDVTVTVTDALGATDSDSFQWTVSDTNRAPAFTAAATNRSQAITERDGLTDLEATDPDGHTLTFSLTSGSLPENITLNGDGTFSGIANTQAAGEYTAVITVSDGQLTDETTLRITVGDYDTYPPVLQKAEIEAGTVIVLTYNEPLDPASTPAPADFTVKVGGTAQPAPATPVVDGRTVTIPLAEPVIAGDAITVSYTPGSAPIRDLFENPAAALTNRQVTNRTPDSVAPTWPAGSSLIASSVDSSKFLLVWTPARDNIAVTQYRVYQDGTLLATVSDTRFTVTGLTRLRTYTFRVEAGDGGGNWSDDGPSVTVTANTDRTPPKVTTLTLTLVNGADTVELPGVRKGNTYSFAVGPADAYILAVTYDELLGAATVQTTPVPVDGYGFTLNLGQLDERKHRFTIEAADMAGVKDQVILLVERDVTGPDMDIRTPLGMVKLRTDETYQSQRFVGTSDEELSAVLAVDAETGEPFSDIAVTTNVSGRSWQVTVRFPTTEPNAWNLRFVGVDKQGNESQPGGSEDDTRMVSLDAEAPTVDLDQDTDTVYFTSASKFTINGTVADSGGSGLGYVMIGTTKVTPKPDGTFSWQTSLKSGRLQEVSIYAVDRAGNRSPVQKVRAYYATRIVKLTTSTRATGSSVTVSGTVDPAVALGGGEFAVVIPLEIQVLKANGEVVQTVTPEGSQYDLARGRFNVTLTGLAKGTYTVIVRALAPAEFPDFTGRTTRKNITIR